MIVEDPPPHRISEGPEKTTNSVGEHSAEELDSQPASNPSPLLHGKANATSIAMQDESPSLHSMANGGHEEKPDQKTESPAPSSGLESEAAPPEPSPSVNEDVRSEGQVTEISKSDPHLESSGSKDGLPVEGVTKLDSASPEELPPPASTPEESESSAFAGKIEETVPESKPSAQRESETDVNAREVEEFPAKEEEGPSISGGIEENVESKPIDEEGLPRKTIDPTQENPALLTPLPPAKKSLLRKLTTKRLKDDELKAKVVIPHYLSKGMVSAIESAGVAYFDGPRINNVTVPGSPLLVFINAKSGGRLGPGLESLLVDLIAPTQVYDLSKCKPAEVLRHGLGFLEKEAEAGDKAALETRNNMRIMVAGGDGTVGWVLGSIAEMGQKDRFRIPPVGVIPLGTGNDLSRSFRWGGSTTSISRKDVKRWLTKSTEAAIAKLDSWEVVVRPAPTRQDAPLKLPHAMHPQHHIPLENPDSSKGETLEETVEETKEETKAAPYFEGSFWNYFSIGMDAQVAYGFHHLRDEAPWLASGRISNQIVYGSYSCAQGWFCAPCTTVPVLRGLRQILQVYTKKSHDVDAQWEELLLPANIRAVVILNLQSYAGGRNPWGRPSSGRREKEGYVEAKPDDGVLEIIGLRDGWHTAFVLLDWLTAVRLCQARAVKLELKGRAHRREAYMQMDGEPWQQPLGAEDEPPAVIEINRCPQHSLCLLRK